MNPVDEMLDAVREGKIEKVKGLLQSDNALASACDDRGDTALLLSIYYRREDITALLLSRHPEMNIYEASALGDVEFVKDAVQKQSELAVSYSHDGFTALHLAVFFGHEDVAQYLITRGADVNAISANRTFARNVTPLHSAAASNRASIVKLLLAHGANVNAVQDGGYTPLHSAAFNGNGEIVELLLSNSADVLRTTDDGKTPFALATEKGHAHLIEQLLAKK
ncbi:MAG: ankyrin repeat domain-containing protein [Ignavibacteriae bacterium]|nr:ankyrin repeat domain-containing protein [Ignavibacteria bacterium]MBI3363448.1 ankyrin repeat domain-containing protein [Ignavibacteriota bacterium]